MRNVDPVTQLDQNLVHWSFEPTLDGVRHIFEFEWLAHLEAGFRFRSGKAAASGNRKPSAPGPAANCASS